MGSMDGFLDLAKTKQLSKDDFDVIAPMLYDNVVRLQLTFTNLFRWAQQSYTIKPDTIELTKFCDLFNETRFLFHHLSTENGIRIEIECDQTIQIPIQQEIIKLILRNWVHNAGKFTPKGGTILMFAKKLPNGVRFGVKDSGIGLTKEQITQLLNRNERITTQGIHGQSGSGLGLLTIKNTLESVGSALHIESEYGKGADFFAEIVI